MLHQFVLNWLLDHGVFIDNGERVAEPRAEMLLEGTRRDDEP
jgi:hypothetical protein